MKPAAKQGDMVNAIDTHVVVAPSGVASPIALPFVGTIDGMLEPSVLIENKEAAVHASTATNDSPHLPIGGHFLIRPSNRASIVVGERSVLANRKPLARSADAAVTCNDPTDLPVGTVIATGTVLVGG